MNTSNTKSPLLLPLPGDRNGTIAPQLALRGEPEAGRYGYSGTGIEYVDEVQKGSVIEYWRVLYRRKGILLVFAIVGALGGVLFTLSQSPVYQAKTSIEIQDVNQEFLNVKSANPVEDSSANALSDIQTQIQILQSASLLERTLDKLHITSVAVLNPETVKIPIWHPVSAVSGSRNQLMELAEKELKVSEAAQTRIIEVTFQSTDPKVASEVANTIASEFIEQNMEARWQIGQRTSAWLGQQLDELRVNLRRSDDALQAYARDAGLIYTGDKENVSTEKLRQLQAQVSQAQADRVQKESRFKMANTTAPESLPDVLNDNSLRALQNNITDLRRQEADLATTFKPDYSKAKRIRAEIGALESALEHERSEIVTRITNDYQEAEHREGLLSAAYDNQVRLVMQDSQKAIQYDILKREVDTNRQVYETMLQRVKESGIASALRPSNIRVIDPARTPEKPYKPNLPLNGVAGLLGGLMLGIVVAVSRDRAHGSFHQPGEAGRLLGLPELGVIPRAGRTKKIEAPSAVSVLAKGQDDAVLTNGRLVALESRPTEFADSFRAVLASIMFSGDKEGRRVLVISSAGPSEGKTTTATNLAIALAKIGKNVLLIDGDIRKPCVHEAFGLGNATGVTDLLHLQVLEAAVADDAVRETYVPKLHVLTSGPPVQAGCDLLFSTSMPRVIAYYRERFDMVIIDTPPLLHMPDARVLGRMADAVVLVARAGRTLREAALAASERLLQDRTPVLGIILNDWNPRSSPDGYYGNYKNAALKKYNAPR